VDVSETALERAKKVHPGIKYVHADITNPNFQAPGKFHFCILAQCWWYIMHKMDITLDNCLSCLVDGGLFVLSQAFLKEQKYGKDIADGFDGALKVLMEYPRLRLLEATYEDSGKLVYYDGLIVFRKVKGPPKSKTILPTTEELGGVHVLDEASEEFGYHGC
jgi:SAM-dependent methyltransferase